MKKKYKKTSEVIDKTTLNSSNNFGGK